MKATEARAEVRKLVIEKGLQNIINADLNEISARTGATAGQLQKAINYFMYSPQAAKYR